MSKEEKITLPKEKIRGWFYKLSNVLQGIFVDAASCVGTIERLMIEMAKFID